MIIIKHVFAGMALFFGMANAYSANLCVTNEAPIFAFGTKNGKVLSVCKEINDGYLVYRFGKVGKVEFEYPKSLGYDSWKKFEFSGISRCCGKVNSGFGDYSLIFSSGNIGYTIFQEWNDEEDTYSIGVMVSGAGKSPTKIYGVKDTQEGSLVLLETEGQRLPNKWGR